MEGKKRKDGLLERAAQVFEIPGEAVGLPLVELVGQHEARMSNHRGILAYGKEEIMVSGGKLLVRFRGEDMELKAMTGSELLITGTIFSVEVE